MESHTRKALAQTRQQLMEAQEKMRLQDRLVQSLQAELKHALLAGSNAPALSPSPSPAPAPLHEKEQEAASHLAASTTQEVFLLGELALSEAERRALEVAECSVRRLSLEQAMAAVAAERALPAAVLLDAASLGAQLERACAWAHTLFEVPLVLLASGDAQAKRAAALGCAGTLQTPLVAAELVAELRRQEEARRLWLQPSVLSSCAAPVSACAAARARRLRAGKGGAVRAHGRLVAVALLFEVRVLDGAEASSEAMLSLCQLVLKRCEELVAGAAGRHGALVTEAGGDRFTVVAGHDGRGMAEGWEGCVGAAHRVAVDAEHTLRREEARFKERGVCVSLRAGVGAGRGYEGLVGCAQEQFAFFGEPVAEAWRCAGMAGEAQMGMSSETMALLFPGDLKGESSEARGEGCSADASLRFVSLRADTEAAAAAVGGGASSASSSCALRSEQQSLSFAHFASQLPRSQSQEASQRGHTLSHLELRLVSKVLERSGAAQARQQSWGAAAVVQGQMSLGRWDGKLEPEPESEGARTVRVLSVDDNPVNQVVIESALLPLGHDVLTCMDTLDVFAMLEKMERLPDIILLDVMLPSGSGLDVLKELRKTYSSTDLPIILVSGRSSKDSIIEGLEAGGNDYIVKPFDTSELVCRINTQLNVSAMVQVRLELARRSELLNKMLPREIVPKILAGETPIHQHMGQASFLVVEIVGFSELSQQVHTVELVELLSALYADFDRLCDKHDVFKVESAADSYIVATGHTADCCDDENHTTKLVHIGLDMIRHARRYINAVSGSFLEVSLGISSGPTSAGVVSAKLPHYCFFGNTINTAKKMQLHGFPSTITVSVSAKAMIEKSVECVSLGIRVIPGSGPVETFVVRHKLTPWERAVESACHGHNFVGYADGTRIRGTPASRLRRVGSPEGPQSASCRTRSYEGSGEGDSENSETGLEGAGARGLAKMERSASDGPQRRPRHRPASRSSRRIASAASTEVGELPRTPRAEPKVETREEGCQAGLETQTALVVAKAAPATPPCRPPEEDPLEELLARARLPHLLEELVANGVDVGTLAHSTESELESLGVRVKGERLKVLRYARAWQTIYG